MNEQLQTIISAALGAAILFAVIYSISLVVSFYRKWREERDEETTVVIKPVLDEVKRVTPETPKAPPLAAMTEEGPMPPGEETFSPEMSAPKTRSQRDALAYEAANRARMVYGEGRLVEAYHYACVARLCGHQRLSSMMSQIRVNWRLAGYPSEKGFVDEHFDPIRSAIGRAMLRIDSNHEADRGYACLTDLASDGNELARDLLKSLPPWR